METRLYRAVLPFRHDDDIVFNRRDRAFTSDSSWQKQHRNGVSPINPHAMRHTAATHMLEEGVHPKVVQEILGHTSIAMTLDRYSHISTDLQEAAAGSLSQRLLRVVSDATTPGAETPDREQTDAQRDARES